MALFISFFIGIQLLHSVVSIPFVQFLHASCNSSEVKAAAEAALNGHNKIKEYSYIYGLQRIFNAFEISEDDYSIFYLVLDVLETKCIGWSKKSWKECEFRPPHELHFGQCTSVIKIYKNSNDTLLRDQYCILEAYLQPVCPGCPIHRDPSEERFQEIARQSLAKFNAENGHDHYFAIWDVTKASSQVVHGILYTVEFIVQETSCPKSTPVSNITECPLLPKETADKGLCKGSVIIDGIDGIIGNEDYKSVTANCEIFPSQSEHQEQHHPHATETPAKQKETVTQVINQRAVRELRVPNLKPFPNLSPVYPNILVLPEGFSQSGSCPGEVLVEIPGVQLDSAPQAENSQTKSDVQH
ncbi:fetuin-B-like [Erythrolamprus reginae]|uniref:fetuin-B-like n=1 Tax=Erythrolamprus reginae TaxID=121349 RepID=UPI00396CAF8C